LVNDLKKINLWEKVKGRIIESQGDISNILEIPEELRQRFKTSFSTDPVGVIEVAARAQKWIDQAISRNMYLETRDIDETMRIYHAAWEKGLKSTYYLHMKPRHTAEQSTTKVNKATNLGKVGFAALKMSAAPVSTTVKEVEQIKQPVSANGNVPNIEDPGEANICLSCE